MIPFLHLGPLTIPTFGLMVATGLLVAAYVLQADFDRRRAQFVKSGYLKGKGEPGHHDEGFLIIGVAGTIGCLLSGDGDYGVPTTLPWGMSFPNGVVPTTEHVHPTPLYEFFIWLVIAAFLWRMGKKAVTGARPKGEIFCGYLILTGVARFLIEFIRINPRSFFGLSNAQAASLMSIIIGFLMFWWIRSSAIRQSKSA